MWRAAGTSPADPQQSPDSSLVTLDASHQVTSHSLRQTHTPTGLDIRGTQHSSSPSETSLNGFNFSNNCCKSTKYSDFSDLKYLHSRWVFPKVFQAGAESFSSQFWGYGGALGGLEELVATAGRLQPPSGSSQESKEAEMVQKTKKLESFAFVWSCGGMMGTRARLSTGEVLNRQPGRSPPPRPAPAQPGCLEPAPAWRTPPPSEVWNAAFCSRRASVKAAWKSHQKEKTKERNE